MVRPPRLLSEVLPPAVRRVLGIYIVASWVALQVLDVVGGNMGLPGWLFRVVVTLVFAGLPLAGGAAFLYDRRIRRTAGGRMPEGGPDDAAIRAVLAQGTRARRAQRALTAVGAALMLLVVVTPAWMLIASPRRAGAHQPAVSSIAVLPFTTVGSDEESRAFALGVHDDLLTQLAKIDSLTVISRTSVMRYADAQRPLPEIAAELGVAVVLEGGVRRMGNRIRINAQLIEAATDRHLWAETYDEELTAANVFAIQADLATEIAAALRARLSPETQIELALHPTESLQAWDLVARARYVTGSRGVTREGQESAAALFQSAIAADSTFAPAHVGYANTRLALYTLGYLSAEEAVPAARAAVERALALDARLAEAHAALGSVLRMEGRLEEAERAYHRAVQLNPGSASVRRNYSNLLFRLGRAEDALAEARRAVQLDPLSPISRVGLLLRLTFAEHYEEAIAEADRLLAMKPDEPEAHYYAGMSWSLLDQHARAITAFRAATRTNPEDAYYAAGLAWAYARAGERTSALATLKQAEAMGAPLKESAIVYAALGDIDSAYVYLERALVAEPDLVRGLAGDPTARALREDARWHGLMAAAGAVRPE